MCDNFNFMCVLRNQKTKINKPIPYIIIINIFKSENR